MESSWINYFLQKKDYFYRPRSPKSFFILSGNLTFADSENEQATLAVTDEEIIETIAKLMGLDFEELKQVFLVRQINIRGNVTEIPLKFQEAKGKKHTLKK